MAAKIISQKRFSKLVASTGSLSQPPGAITRLSNLLFTERGSLQIADGSASISQAIPSAIISALGAFVNLQPGQFPYYEILAYSTATQLPDVTGFMVSSITSGSDNPAGTYSFSVVANVGSTHTNARNSGYSLVTAGFDGLTFTWTADPGATGYTIYYVIHLPLHPLPYYVLLGTSSTTTFSITGVLPTTPAVVPSPNFNNTYEIQLYVDAAISSPISFTPVTAGSFPFLPPVGVTIAPGSPGFEAEPEVIGFSPYGGLSGVVGPLPQLIQFAGLSILILGNGYAPQTYDPSTGPGGAVTPLANTFQAAYPTWQPSVDWLTGSQLSALYGSVNYLFTATQGGVSGSSTPSWNFTTGSQTSDGSAVWTCNGPIVVSVAPIGAAHAVAYAGSLWLANTHPRTTSYPSWISTNTYVAGQQIVVVDGSGNQWLFQVQTGGVSGSSAPSWSFTIGTTTADNTVVWLNIMEFENSAGIQTHSSGVQTTNGSGNWSFVGTQWRSNFNPGSSALADLVFMGFGFSIPAGATILGVIVTANLVSQATTTGTVSQVALYYMNAVLGTIKTPGTNFTTKPTAQSYGSTSDSWSASLTPLTPAIVNDPSFGFAIAATCDSIRVFIGQPFQMTVYYSTTTSGSSALAAGIDGPTCLKMSDSNNPNSWNPVNTAFIGRDDGTQITGLQPFTIAALGISPTGSLCVFKEFTTYQVIGVFGSTSFEIQPAQTNLGCIAARSIQFIPGFGVCRFTHLGFAVFDGINDRLISEDIRPYLFGGADSEADLIPVDPSYLYLSQSAQTVAPPMYLCAMPLTGQTGALTRLFCYDLVMKAWAVIDLPWSISSMSTISVGEGYPLVLVGKTDGTVQRMQTGDLNWDQGAEDQLAVRWSFRSPDIFGEGSSQRMFFEQVSIKGYGSAAMVASILANLWLDGQQLGVQAVDVVPQGGGNLFEARIRIFKTGYRAHLDISGNGAGATGVIDSLDWSVSPKSSLARRIIG